MEALSALPSPHQIKSTGSQGYTYQFYGPSWYMLMLGMDVDQSDMPDSWATIEDVKRIVPHTVGSANAPFSASHIMFLTCVRFAAELGANVLIVAMPS